MAAAILCEDGAVFEKMWLWDSWLRLQVSVERCRLLCFAGLDAGVSLGAASSVIVRRIGMVCLCHS